MEQDGEKKKKIKKREKKPNYVIISKNKWQQNGSERLITSMS